MQHYATIRKELRGLKKDGWTVLRFWNHEVLTDLDNVCPHIIRTIREDRI